MKTVRQKMFLIFCVVAVSCLLGMTFYLIYQDQKKQESISHFNSGVENSSSYDVISYKGKTYYYNTQMSLILLIGTDSKDDLKDNKDYGQAGQADSLNLIVLNRDSKRIKILPINRDTITAVHSFTDRGYKLEPVQTHLAFAFTFGDGGTDSCLNTCEAVSDLLKGIPIDYYAAMNLNTLSQINSIAGNIKVTVPNNDVVHLHPELTENADVILTDDNTLDFLRYRNTEITGSNHGRMARSAAFLRGFLIKAKSYTDQDFQKMWEQLSQEDHIFRTSITDTDLLTLVSEFKDCIYDPATDLLEIPGKADLQDGYDVYYPDQEALLELIVNTFYNKMN